MHFIKSLKSLPWHIFAFPAALVIHEIESVKSQLATEQAMPAFLAVESVAIALFLLAFIATRKIKIAGLITTAVMMISLSYLGVAFAVSRLVPDAPPIASLALMALILAGAVGGVLKKTWLFGGKTYATDYDALQNLFNLMTCFMLIINLVPLVSFNISLNQKAQKWQRHYGKIVEEVIPKKSLVERPDIYYIILDAFAHQKTLTEFGGYDNKAFIDYLKSKGFILPQRAASNYDRTHLSITSSLNLDYLNPISDEAIARGGTIEQDYPDVLYERLMADNALFAIYKKLGYKIVSVADMPCPGADKNYLDEYGVVFTTAFAKLTPLWGLEPYTHILRDAFCSARLSMDKHLSEILTMNGPKLVFIHSNLSHPPSVFDAKGKRKELPANLLNDDLHDFAAYVEQVKYTEKQAVKAIDQIIAAYPADRQPVIILQADHGPYKEMDDKHAYFNEVMRILNAYRIPMSINKKSIESMRVDLAEMTPVNSFRYISNECIGLQNPLPLLPNQAWCSPERSNPVGWRIVNEQLDF